MGKAGMGLLHRMQRRRVGVTARSRRNVGPQATGTPQFATEIAAPLKLRTPAGTCGGSCKSSANGSLAIKAWGIQRQKNHPSDGAPVARVRRGLTLRQGASPLRPRPPFPRRGDCRTEGIRQGSASRANRSAPLTDPLRPEERAEMRERGRWGTGSAPRNRPEPTTDALRAYEALPHAPSGGKPPETPNREIFLDTRGPSHGSRDREGALMHAKATYLAVGVLDGRETLFD